MLTVKAMADFLAEKDIALDTLCTIYFRSALSTACAEICTLNSIPANMLDRLTSGVRVYKHPKRDSVDIFIPLGSMHFSFVTTKCWISRYDETLQRFVSVGGYNMTIE